MRVFHGSTLVASQSETTHWHDNGRNRPAISSRQLGSGMRLNRDAGLSHQTSPSLSSLSSAVSSSQPLTFWMITYNYNFVNRIYNRWT